MTVRIPRGMRPAIERAESQIQKLTSRIVAETLGLEREVQWSADVEPLGTGSWGVVYPLVDERFVLKVTADPTEGPLISTVMAEPYLHNHVAIIHYFALRVMSEPHVYLDEQMKLYVVVAERLNNVGGLADRAFELALRSVLAYGGAVVAERSLNTGRVSKFESGYMDAVGNIPDSPLSDFFIQFYDYTDGGVLADVHSGNLGQRAVDWGSITDGDIPLSPNDYYWVISDLGQSSIEGAGDIEELRENPRKNPREKGRKGPTSTEDSIEIIRKAKGLYEKAKALAYDDGSATAELGDLYYESSDMLDALDENEDGGLYREVRAYKTEIEQIYYEAIDLRNKAQLGHWQS